MKNNQDYLNSVMKKYSRAKAKRRQTVTVLSSVSLCLVLFVAGTQIRPSIVNDSLKPGPQMGGSHWTEPTVSQATSSGQIMSAEHVFEGVEGSQENDNHPLGPIEGTSHGQSSFQEENDAPVEDESSHEVSIEGSTGNQENKDSSAQGGQSYMVKYDSDSTNDTNVKPGITSGIYGDGIRPVDGDSDFDPQWLVGGLLTLFAVVGVVLVIQKRKK